MNTKSTVHKNHPHVPRTANVYRYDAVFLSKDCQVRNSSFVLLISFAESIKLLHLMMRQPVIGEQQCRMQGSFETGRLLSTCYRIRSSAYLTPSDFWSIDPQNLWTDRKRKYHEHSVAKSFLQVPETLMFMPHLGLS